MKKTRHKWTAEEDQFLRDYYPDHGVVDTLNTFNTRFDCCVTKRSIEHRVYDMGITLSADRYAQKQIENGRNFNPNPRRKPGYINPDTGLIKTETGWTRLGAILDVPKGYYAVHLDRDPRNNNPDNIMIISKQESMLMTKYNMWSQDPEITKTGILCCRLQQTLKKRKNNGN